MTNASRTVLNMPNATNLQPGDVLLMLGDGAISQLIAWCGDSLYSHAALVGDHGELIEVSAEGVCRYPLARRLKDTANYHYVDAFRPLSYTQQPLQVADVQMVMAHAQSFPGVSHPMNQLATLGVIVAIRGKLPEDHLARVAVHEALDYLVRDHPSHMLGSEMVYRAFAECAAEPAKRLAPQVVIQPRGTAPLPRIDWMALLRELGMLLHPQRWQALEVTHPILRALARSSSDPPPSASESKTAWHVNDEELQRKLQQSQQMLGVSAHAMALGSAAGANSVAVHSLNPKLVTPLDLASTPSHTALGRLMQRPHAVPRVLH